MLPMTRRNGNGSNLLTQGSYPRFDTLFNQVFGEDGGFEAVAANWANAPMAIWEDEDHIYIEVDAPGVAESDIDLTLHQNVLTIKGSRKAAEGRKHIYNSRGFGSFERTVRLPETVGSEGVEAKMKDGVLSLVLRKTPEAKPKKITVQREG
jgi:HSP20 family protein